MHQAALNHLQSNYSELLSSNELLTIQVKNIENQIANTQQRLQSLECVDSEYEQTELYQKVLMEIYSVQRMELFKMRKEKIYSDEELRKFELQIDLNEMNAAIFHH